MRENPDHSSIPGDGESFEQLVQNLGGAIVKMQPGTCPINPLDRPWPFDSLDRMVLGGIGAGKTTKLRDFPLGVRVHRLPQIDG